VNWYPGTPVAGGALTAEMIQQLDPEQAYIAMFAFIEEYWNVVSRPAEIGDLLETGASH
jgi:hypothetical protein